MSFTKIAAESAFVATQNYDARDVAVVAGQNTLLAELVNETIVDHNPVNQSGQYRVDVDSMITRTNAADPIVGYSEHSQKLDEISEKIAGFLEQHIYGFKTQVIPMVNEFAERISARIALIEGSPDSGARVERWNRIAPFMESSLIDSFERSKEVVVRDLPMEMKLEPVSQAEIEATIKTGSSTVDAAVFDYFSEKGPGWLESAFKNIFTCDPSGLTPSGLNTYINGREEGVAYALFTFLVARRLWDKPPANCDMPLQKYSDLMVAYRNQAAQRLSRELELQERESKQGKLIRSCTKNGLGETVIVVDEKLYKEFLKAGGTNEMLLGNALSDTPMNNYQAIIDNKETLARAWNTHYSFSRSLYEQKRLTVMKTSLMSEFDHMVRGMSDDDFPLQERALARNLFLDFSRTLKAEDFNCINTLALKAICRSRFHATHAEMFLMAMDRATKANKDISTAEAATIATLEYVSRWVASQMQVVGANAASVF